MSDDRFKQARRSLYEQHNQRQQGFDDFEDEATALVDISQQQQEQPAFSPPPGYTPDQYPPPPSGQSLQIGVPGNLPDAAQATEFVNLNEMPPQANSGFTPENDFGGYEGNTQFVNLNDVDAPAQSHVGAAPQMGVAPQMSVAPQIGGSFIGQPAGPGSVLNDPVLLQSYAFGPESINEGAFTIIFAQNASGMPVILKRIFAGDGNGLPPDIRQRVAEIDAIKHPRLVTLNGMIATPSGAWVEMNRPPGYRLTDILTQNGPQPPEVVGKWIHELADILAAIHDASEVYANLTPDAVWIQEDGSVILEPFDILSFEDRGDLAPFGPREMAFPPDQRMLTATVDTFCLASVAFAALTGLPLDMGKAGEVDPKFGKAFQDALAPNPAERPDIRGFAKPFTPKKKGQLPDLDAKFLIIGVGAMLFLILGVLYWQKSSADEEARLKALAEATPEAQVVPEDGKDPRVTIVKDINNDPIRRIVATMETAPSRDRDQAAKLRIKARQELKDIDKDKTSRQKTRYAAALSHLTEAIRLTGEQPEDLDILLDLYDRDLVTEIRRNYFLDISDSFGKEKIGSARTVYSALAAIEPGAEAVQFFNDNKSATVKRLVPITGNVPPPTETKPEGDSAEEKPEMKEDK